MNDTGGFDLSQRESLPAVVLNDSSTLHGCPVMIIYTGGSSSRVTTAKSVGGLHGRLLVLWQQTRSISCCGQEMFYNIATEVFPTLHAFDDC